MAEKPEVNVVQISRDDKGFGGSSEGTNACVPRQSPPAFFDATGVHQNPLTPAYVTTLLKAKAASR